MAAATSETPPRHGHNRPRERGPARLVASALLAMAMLVTACDTGSATYDPPPPPPPPPAPTGSPSVSDALAALQNRAAFVLDGSVQPRPLFMDWESIEQGKRLAEGKASAMCQALDLPGADDVLASVALLAMNAVSEKFRHRPAITDPDTEAMFKKAIGWVNKTCAGWEPQLVSLVKDTFPTASPTADDPDTVAGDPGLRWYLEPPPISNCQHPVCWRAQVLVDAGCPASLEITMTITDANTGIVVGTAPFHSNESWPAGVTVPFDIWWDTPGAFNGQVTSISCL
jgi:hypothetical protein